MIFKSAADIGDADFLELGADDILFMLRAVEPSGKDVLRLSEIDRQILTDIEIIVIHILDPVGKFPSVRRGVIEVLFGQDVSRLIDCGLGQAGIDGERLQTAFGAVFVSKPEELGRTGMAPPTKSTASLPPKKKKRPDSGFERDQSDGESEKDFYRFIVHARLLALIIRRGGKAGRNLDGCCL